MSYTTQVIFKVGTERYGFDIRLVTAIEEYEGVTPIPHTSANILGIMNLRGDIIPVFSLRKKFGLDEIPKDAKTQLLVTKIQDMLIGFKVDAVLEILEFEEQELHPMPAIVQTEETAYADCAAGRNKELILLMHNDRIISTVEKQAAGLLIDEQACT